MMDQVQTKDKAVSQTLAVFQLLLDDYPPRDFVIRLWDGSPWPAEIESPRFTLTLKHPGALRRMFANTASDLSLGEAYIFDDFDMEGDIEAMYPIGDYLYWKSQDWSTFFRLRLAWMVLNLPKKRPPNPNGRQAVALNGRRDSLERNRRAVAYQYDLSNDFFALWLDQRMVYSCAYFATADEDLNTAQERKLDYICRKLRLRPGERLLDIGCGWGGLVIYAAQHYGVDALGITLSRAQAELANERIQQAGLSDRCRIEVRDYREVDEPGGFDKLASIGMFEHVGEAMLPLYCQQAWRLLRPGGVFLNHGIAWCATAPPLKQPTFCDRYVFPDTGVVPINVTLRHAEAAGFEVRDVENLREHYALTLRHWVRNLKAHHDELLQIVDETTFRVYMLFMSGAAYGFAIGRVNLFQALLVKPDQGNSGQPLTRADWYTSSETPR
ncbi:MAG: class I SAM-dependent methyltransferase [Gammaproteobacteria bacterium]|nr:class I SAM-dependent methyltransferase [Gammaproteobacteria bacterium]